MKFFVPYAKDDIQAEHVWKSTKQFADSKGYKSSNKRIFRIRFVHEGRNCVDEVGQIDSYGIEKVLVILEGGNIFYACTENRGVVRGDPYLVGENEILEIEYFEKN